VEALLIAYFLAIKVKENARVSIIDIRITPMVALVNRFIPLIYLFSQIILVGSIAAMNTGSTPKIFGPSLSEALSAFALNHPFLEKVKASL